MGSAVSTVGSLIGAPFKGIFESSCNEFCSETWDVVCYVEHFCISNLLRLLMIFGLGYVGMVMVYLVLRIGIFQCVAKGFCKMWWGACMTYIHIFEFSISSLCHKLKHVKRVKRRHRVPDLEKGLSHSGSEPEFSCRKRKYRVRSRGRGRRRRGRSFRLGRQVSVVPYGTRTRRRHPRVGSARVRVGSPRFRVSHRYERSRFV